MLRNYSALKNSQKEPIFLEEFINNSNSWFIGLFGNVNGSIANGLYTLSSTSNGYRLNKSLNSINLNSINYEYEVRANSNDNINIRKDINGFSLGYTNGYVFFVNNLTNNVALKFGNIINNSNYTDIYSNPITSDFNTYTIRRIKSQISIFINGNYIKTFEAKDVDARIGITFSNELEVDYIRIHKIILQ